MTDKQIIEKTKDWLWELTEPNEKFGGFGICPFLKKELTNDDIEFIILKGDDDSYGEDFKNGLDNWINENKYNSVLFICLGEVWEHIERKSYQKAIQDLMKEQGYKNYKALCFSPYEDKTAAGVKTRINAPYFLINIMNSKDLGKAHEKMIDTKYFDNFTKDELVDIKIYGKKTKKALDINKKN